MSRLIDADAFEKFIRENCADSLVDLWCELVRRQPTIEAAPVVHGEWKFNISGAGHYYCSVCGGRGDFYGKYNYCPSCGAMMKGCDNSE